MQSQARELSQLRQQIKESRRLGGLQRRQLEELRKAFKELLQASQVDYYMGEVVKEQLDKSLGILDRLEGRLDKGSRGVFLGMADITTTLHKTRLLIRYHLIHDKAQTHMQIKMKLTTSKYFYLSVLNKAGSEFLKSSLCRHISMLSGKESHQPRDEHARAFSRN